jgi:hypothetical protein
MRRALIALVVVASCETNTNERPCADNGSLQFWTFTPEDSLRFSVVPDDRPLDTVRYHYRVDSFRSPSRVYLRGFARAASGGATWEHAGWVEVTNSQPYCRALRWNVNQQALPASTPKIYQYLGLQTPSYGIFYNLKVQRLPN